MAPPSSQKKWRNKNRLIKKQLNVMAKNATHESLENFAKSFNLRGKGEAVTFACFVTRALIQRADYNADSAQMLNDLADIYLRDRKIHSA